MLTPRQRAAYDFIARFCRAKGYSPSYDEIRRHLRLASLNSVAKLVTQLRRRGFLEPAPLNAKRWLTPAVSREPASRLEAVRAPERATQVPAGSAIIPLLGTIAAGAPIEAIENPEEIEVPAGMTGPGERYALRVRGDSMIEDGIHDGDIVVVRRARRAERGQTVVAVIDGEATLKRFHPLGRDVELRPANPALRPRRVAADRVEIRGVLAGLLRRYGR
jgi:repressor LexA